MAGLRRRRQGRAARVADRVVVEVQRRQRREVAGLRRRRQGRAADADPVRAVIFLFQIQDQHRAALLAGALRGGQGCEPPRLVCHGSRAAWYQGQLHA